MRTRTHRKDFVNDYGVFITVLEGVKREVYALSVVSSDVEQFIELPSNTPLAALEELTMNKVLTIAHSAR